MPIDSLDHRALRRGAVLTLATLLLAGPLVAADDKPMQKPYLWLVELPGSEPGFVFGTMHVPDERVVNQPRIVDEAIERSDVFFAEIPMDLAALTEAAGQMMRTDGRTLKDDLPPDLYARVKKYVEKHGASIEMLHPQKTWAAMMNVMMMDYMKEMGTGIPMDMKLYTQAATAGKTVGGIETLDEQLGVFANTPKQDIIHLFRTAMDQLEEAEKEGKSYTRQLIDKYLVGDHEALRALAFEEYDTANAVERRFLEELLIKRDARITKRFVAKMKEHPKKRHFLAVGAAHLGGDDGILALLKKAGATVTRLTPDDMDKLPSER